MVSMLGGNRRSGDRGGRAPLTSAVVVLGLALALAAGPAVAKKITGTKRSEKVVGTKGADRIKGKGGNDLVKGKAGNDKLKGGKGSDKVAGGKGNDAVIGGPQPDTVVGGAGVDRHFGGSGNDLVNAADGRRDTVIDGGPGANKCIIDSTLELSIVRNCGTIQAGGGTGPGGTGPGGTGPGGGSGPGPGQGLRVLGYEELGCTSPPLPAGCLFHISGDGADAGVGTVEGGGGVTQVLGLALSINAPNWDAQGAYSCTGPGFLRVIIGAESVDVPVGCPS